MVNSKRLLPSMSMLIAFDAAARSGSFTAAAHEINLTQGAVSKQIHNLEELLGIQLFHRYKQTISLTDEGQTYAQEILLALNAIRAASLQLITSPQGGVLNLAVLPTFGTRWLMPRLPTFLQEHPQITVKFVTKTSPFDFMTEDIHAAIHYGSDDWSNAESTYLMGEAVVAVCAPSFKQQHHISHSQDLTEVPLLHITSRADAWRDWFTALGITPPVHQGMYFEQFLTAAQASVAGLGAALLPEFLVQNELQRNELVKIDTPIVKSMYGYHLVIPQQNATHKPSLLLKKWLLKQVAIEANN